MERAFFINVLPPQVFLLIGITKEDDTPCGIVRALAEVCRINDEVDWSRLMYFLWNNDCVNGGDECFLVVPCGLCKFADRLLVKDVCKPNIIMVLGFPLAAESSSAFIATVCLNTILSSLFYRLISATIGAKVPFF